MGNGCTLAIESQMIGHTPEVMEKLEKLGIAVLIDQSSNEPHPLGRAEWIKLYGALLNEEEKATSTVTLEMESFYVTVKDADYIIYNNTIDGEVRDLEDLLEKNELFGDFKAVKNGNVWCTSQNMFQDTTGIGQMIQSFHLIFSGQADELDEVPYLYRLR